MLSTAMSDGVKCLVLLNAVSEGTVNSPIRKNPKQHNVLAVHGMITSSSWNLDDHTARILCRIWGVMRKQVSLGVDFKSI